MSTLRLRIARYRRQRSQFTPLDRLLKDLIEAHKRGVEVHVILDYPKPQALGEGGPKNQEVYEKIKEARIVEG